MTTSKLLDRVGQRLLLLRALLLGQLPRVAALARRLDAEVQPLRAERLHLLGDLGAHVVARRPRAEPPGRRERLQPATPAAEHEHLRGRDRARRGREHRVEARGVLGAEQRRLVPGHVRLRRQRVHRLRAADPRNRLHRERRDLGVRERARRLGRRQRREEPDEQRAVAELGRPPRLVGARDLDDHVGAPRVADPRPGVLEQLIRDQRGLARARLDDDLDVLRAEALDDVGHHRDAALAVRGLLGNTHDHWGREGIGTAAPIAVWSGGAPATAAAHAPGTAVAPAPVSACAVTQTGVWALVRE